MTANVRSGGRQRNSRAGNAAMWRLEVSSGASARLGQAQSGTGSVAMLETSSHQPRAFQLLAAQPISLVGLSQAQRDELVVTAVADERGEEHCVSRFGDAIWDMSPEFDGKNRSRSSLCIRWPQDLPRALVNDAKAALYCALKRGRDDRPWSAGAVVNAGSRCIRTMRYLASLGIDNFGSVRALHLSDYIADQSSRLKPRSIGNRLLIVDLVWHFAQEVFSPLSEHPWGGSSLWVACGCTGDDGGPIGLTGKTPVIPLSIQRVLFAYCEAKLLGAEETFRARDSGRITMNSAELTSLRDAILYLLQVTSGMRNSESTGVTRGCWRTEHKLGVAFHWVTTKEIKTNRGIVDFLVPPEALAALEVLQCYAQPLQDRLRDEARWLEQALRDRRSTQAILANGMTLAEGVQRLNHVREIEPYLFLGLDPTNSDHLGKGSRVDVVSGGSCGAQLKMLAKSAGTTWELANHQCRRTFAYNVANSKLGRMSLVFLKWQLKHVSLSWTQLYASNPFQDHSLYDEMFEEMVLGRAGLMEGWMQSDVQLSGGAGKKLMQARAIRVDNLGDLLRYTAEGITIRSTGHAWCLTATQGCHGQGVYDPAMCAGCSAAVIDREFEPAWQMIHLENLRLAAITDCGPAVAQKAERAIRRSAQVLAELGVPLPTARWRSAYGSSGG